jgi:hypothetical protein
MFDKWSIKVPTLLLSVSFLSPMAQAKDGKNGLYFDHNSKQYFINNKATFDIRPIEDQKFLDRIEVSIDNQSYQKYDGKIQFDKEGFHIVRFKAVDPVLNWSPVESFRIYVDLSHPKTHPEFSGESFAKEGKLYIGPRTKFQLTAYDNLSGIHKTYWKLGDKALEFKSPLNFSKSGDYKIMYSSIDNVGNTENWQEFSFFVDSEPPISKASVNGHSHQVKDKLFIDKGSFIALEAQDKDSGIKSIEYKLNNDEVRTYKEKIAVESAVTSLKYRAIDNVGNVENWKVVKVYLDAIAPQLSIKEKGIFRKIAGKYYAVPGFKVTASLTDRESGAKFLTVDNKAPEAVKYKEFVFKEVGSFQLQVRGEDRVGNISNTEFFDIIIDKDAPETKLTTTNNLVEKDKIFLSSLPNKVQLNALDKGVGVNYIEASYDKKNFFKVTGPIDLATWKTPKRTLYFRSVDQLGNKEPLKSINLYVRNHGPKVDLFVESGTGPAVPLSKLKGNMRSAPSERASVKESKRRPSSKKSIKKKKYKQKKYKKRSKKRRRR